MSFMSISLLVLLGAAVSVGTLPRREASTETKLTDEEREEIRNLLKSVAPQTHTTNIEGKMSKEYLQKLVRMRPESCKVNGKTIHSMVFCPTPRVNENSYSWNCIRYSDLCDGHIDCPNQEDEDPTFCMFQKLNNIEVNALRRSVDDIDRRVWQEPAELKYNN